MDGAPKLSYAVIFLVLSKNCVNLSMHYVIILKTRVDLSIYCVDMSTHCLIMLKNHFILSQRGDILSKKHVNLCDLLSYIGMLFCQHMAFTCQNGVLLCQKCMSLC